MGHDSLNCNEAHSCVNCKKDHLSYSRNWEKWIIKKETQTILTKQNIIYTEARKIIESWTLPVGITFATVTSKEKIRKYQSIGIQRESFKNSESQVINREIQPQTCNKNLSKYLKNETETFYSQK